MSLSDGVISLATIGYDLINQESLAEAWNEFSRISIDSLATDCPDVYRFADQCLSLFSIQHIIIPESEEIHLQQLLPTTPSLFDNDQQETVGVVYLTSSHMPGTVNIGILLLPEARNLGLGKRAASLTINWALETLRFHRVQAQIVDGDPDSRDISVGFFTGLGFSHEGTARRALFCPPSAKLSALHPYTALSEWRDVITLAMLDTDWAVKDFITRIPRNVMKSRWDDLFARQEKERQEMLRLEVRGEQRKRRASARGAAQSNVEFAQLDLQASSTFLVPSIGNSPSFIDIGQGPALEDCHAVPRSPVQSWDNNSRCSTPTPHQRSSSPSNSPPTSFRGGSPRGLRTRARGGSRRRRQRRGPRTDEAWETSSASSASTSSSASLSAWSDAEIVPRSPSVASTASSDSSWDLLSDSASTSSVELAIPTDEEWVL